MSKELGRPQSDTTFGRGRESVFDKPVRQSADTAPIPLSRESILLDPGRYTLIIHREGGTQIFPQTAERNAHQTEKSIPPRGAVEVLGDPDLGVYVLRPDDPVKRRAEIVSHPLQKVGLDLLLSRPDEDIPLKPLEIVIGRDPRKYLNGLATRFNDRDDQIISKVTDADGRVTGYRYNSGNTAPDQA